MILHSKLVDTCFEADISQELEEEEVQGKDPELSAPAPDVKHERKASTGLPKPPRKGLPKSPHVTFHNLSV